MASGLAWPANEKGPASRRLAFLRKVYELFVNLSISSLASLKPVFPAGTPA